MRYQGTARNCAKASVGPSGPICQAPLVALCCNTDETYYNCLTPSVGTKCRPFTGFEPGPVEAFCCEAMDLASCKHFFDARFCPGDFNPYCCESAGTVPTVIRGKRFAGGLNCTNLNSEPTGYCNTRQQSFCC